MGGKQTREDHGQKEQGCDRRDPTHSFHHRSHHLRHHLTNPSVLFSQTLCAVSVRVSTFLGASDTVKRFYGLWAGAGMRQKQIVVRDHGICGDRFMYVRDGQKKKKEEEEEKGTGEEEEEEEEEEERK